MNELFECEFIGKLLRVIQEIWEMFFEVLEKDCSCKESDNCCANLLYYIFKGILTIGFFISTIAFSGFSLGFILLWSFLKLIILIFVKCCESCRSKNNKAKKNNENPNNTNINKTIMMSIAMSISIIIIITIIIIVMMLNHKILL